jgi:hypothetical protein
MKKLLIAIALVLLAGCNPNTAEAWTISWDAIAGADGYRMSYGEMPDPTTPPASYTTVDAGTSTVIDLDSLGLSQGARYEFKFHCYVSTPPSYGCESDTFRWTYPSDPIVVEMPVEEKVINIRIER